MRKSLSAHRQRRWRERGEADEATTRDVTDDGVSLTKKISPSVDPRFHSLSPRSGAGGLMSLPERPPAYLAGHATAVQLLGIEGSTRTPHRSRPPARPRDRLGAIRSSRPRDQSRRLRTMNSKIHQRARAALRCRTCARYSSTVIVSATPASTSAPRRAISASHASAAPASASVSRLRINSSASRARSSAGRRRISASMSAADIRSV